jgi:hypothetical protein
MQNYNNAINVTQKKSKSTEETSKMFLLFEEAREGQISWAELNEAQVDRQVCKIYLARELQFLGHVAHLGKFEVLADVMKELHHSLLRKSSLV